MLEEERNTLREKLHKAILNSQSHNYIESLINDAGKEVSSIINYSDTPDESCTIFMVAVMTAIKEDDLKVITLLLKAGADCKMKSWWGGSAVDYLSTVDTTGPNREIKAQIPILFEQNGWLCTDNDISNNDVAQIMGES